MFGILVILYLFLGGCGAGVMLFTSLVSLRFYAVGDHTFEQAQVFARQRAYSYVAAFVVVTLSCLCLMADLGRPDRVLNLFLHPTASYISAGTFILAAAVVVCALLAASGLMYLPRFTGRVKKVLEVLAVVVSVALMTYTGLFLYALKTVPFWHTPCVPVLFVLSALSTGMSLGFVMQPFGRDVWALSPMVRQLRVLHLVIVVLELLVLAVYIAWASLDPYVARSVELLLAGELSEWFYAGALACGVVVPLVSESFVLATRRSGSHWLLDALVLVGGFALRYCIVSAGMY